MPYIVFAGQGHVKRTTCELLLSGFEDVGIKQRQDINGTRLSTDPASVGARLNGYSAIGTGSGLHRPRAGGTNDFQLEGKEWLVATKSWPPPTRGRWTAGMGAVGSSWSVMGSTDAGSVGTMPIVDGRVPLPFNSNGIESCRYATQPPCGTAGPPVEFCACGRSFTKRK